jgi:hypothetical protein
VHTAALARIRPPKMRRNPVAIDVARHPGELPDKDRPLGARAHEGHVPAQDVDALRQLVERGGTDRPTNRPQSAVIRDAPPPSSEGASETPSRSARFSANCQ